MPSAGLTIASNGLNLQAQTPGNADKGNANISGTMIATVFSTSTIKHSPPAQSNNLMLGEGVSLFYAVGDGANYGANNVIVGDYSFTGLAGIQRGQWNTAVGSKTKTPNWGGTAIGYLATAGHTGVYQANSDNCVAIGYQTVADKGSTVIGGSSSSGTGLNCIMIAAGGYTATCASNECVTIGNVNVSVATNVIVVYPKTPTLTLGAGNSNSIIIGDASHVNVKLGPYTLSQSMGGSRNIVNVNSVATVADGTIIYTAITAARVVTLPLASAVPNGYRLLVLDMSGAASAVNTITLTAAGADVINGLTTSVIATAYGYKEVVSDGISKWTVVRG